MSDRDAHEQAATERAAPGDQREPRGLGGVLTSNLVVVVSLIGAVMYVGASLGQTAFYGRFGVDPAEVGLGYTETLTQLGRVFLPVLVLGVVVFLMVASKINLPSLDPVGVVALLITITVLGLLVLTVGVPVWYTDKAEAVGRGEPLRPEADRLLTVVVNPLGIRAEPVRVTWTRRGGDDLYSFGSEKPIYLGRADGVTVLYDPARERTVRVPDTEVVIVRDGG